MLGLSAENPVPKALPPRSHANGPTPPSANHPPPNYWNEASRPRANHFFCHPQEPQVDWRATPINFGCMLWDGFLFPVPLAPFSAAEPRYTHSVPCHYMGAPCTGGGLGTGWTPSQHNPWSRPVIFPFTPLSEEVVNTVNGITHDLPVLAAVLPAALLCNEPLNLEPFQPDFLSIDPHCQCGARVVVMATRPLPASEFPDRVCGSTFMEVTWQVQVLEG